MTIMMSRKALEEYGLVNLGKIYWNLSPAVLVEHALARNEGMLASNGAFAATTGVHTGRSPKDKYVVANEESATKIWWGEINHPMSPEVFELVRNNLAAYLQGPDASAPQTSARTSAPRSTTVQASTAWGWKTLFAR